MYRVALKILLGDKTKFIGLLIGIGFTAFLITFALAYFAGFMSRGFALISENPTAKIWVMDKAVDSTETTINMSDNSLNLVKSVQGVNYAVPLYLGDVTARFANGHFQSFQMIGVDDATLSGMPKPTNALGRNALRLPQSVIVDNGGTEGKLQTPIKEKDQWSSDGAHIDAPTRKLHFGDELLIDDRSVMVSGVSHTIPRFPPHPLLYTSLSNFKRLTPSQNKRITFIMVAPAKGVDSATLAQKISQQTGLKAITADAFKKETVLWFFVNSEDVGDMVNMVVLAMLVGFGVTGVMLYMFTYENLKQYAVLKAIGASNEMLSKMVFFQALIGVLLGVGIGVGLSSIVSELIASSTFPFRMMWFAPLFGFLGVLIVSVTATVISIKPVLKLEPFVVFKS